MAIIKTGINRILDVSRLSKIEKMTERIYTDFQNLIDDYDKSHKKIEFDNDAVEDRIVHERNLQSKLSKENESLLCQVTSQICYYAYTDLHLTMYREQVLGGLVLYFGNIAEMKTGEGKTLASLIPIILHASFDNEFVNVVTANEYLVQRDRNYLSPVYDEFNLTSATNLNSMTLSQKQEAYKSNILYSTASELGFDYLRNNSALSFKDVTSTKSRDYVLIDEVDSVLIDEAKTPLIIADGHSYNKGAYALADKFSKSLNTSDYDTKTGVESKSVVLTKSGELKANEFYHKSEGQSIYDDMPSDIQVAHLVAQSLNANYGMRENVDYVLGKSPTGQVIHLVDQFTGRVLDGREFSNGLQQALEAKHSKQGVKITDETLASASITIQNFFKLYKTKAGMSGTAKTDEKEFVDTYNMYVVEIPTHKKMILQKSDYADVYLTKHQKNEVIIDEILSTHNNEKRPILVGTHSVKESELFAKTLKSDLKDSTKIKILNAKQDEHEAEIIAQAGRKGSITISTNMAGRGTDIKLDDYSKEHGGLLVINTSINESKRVDLQLAGRAGRQGDPGSALQFASLQDDAFHGLEDSLRRINTSNIQPSGFLGPRISKLISNQVQEKLSSANFDARKSSLEYDDAVDLQRTQFYKLRNSFLSYREFIDNTLSYPSVEISDGQKTSLVNSRAKIDSLLSLQLDKEWARQIKKLDDLRNGITYRSYDGSNATIIYQREAYKLFKSFKTVVRNEMIEKGLYNDNIKNLQLF